ncbi:hypothetical protein QJQ45_017714, partial [Haematococcus lacustris]
FCIGGDTAMPGLGWGWQSTHCNSRSGVSASAVRLRGSRDASAGGSAPPLPQLTQFPPKDHNAGLEYSAVLPFNIASVGTPKGIDKPQHVFCTCAQKLKSIRDPAPLTQDITACTNWQSLQAILQRDAQHMNHIHVSALLVRLAKVVGQQREQQAQCPSDTGARALDRFLGEVSALVSSRLEQFDPRALANCLWAVARLGYRPSHSLLQRFLFLTFIHMHDMKGQELANTAWALASMHVYPGAAWLARLHAHVAAKGSAMKAQELANTSWAMQQLPALQKRPGASCSPAPGRTAPATAPTVSSGMSSVEAAAWKQVQTAAAVALPAFKPQELLMLLLAMQARLTAYHNRSASHSQVQPARLHPDSQEEAAGVAALHDGLRLLLLQGSRQLCEQGSLGRLSARDVANLGSAVAAAGAPGLTGPHGAAAGRAREAAAAARQEYKQTTWLLGRAVGHEMSRRPHEFGPQGLVRCLWAFGPLGFVPDPHWLAACGRHLAGQFATLPILPTLVTFRATYPTPQPWPQTPPQHHLPCKPHTLPLPTPSGPGGATGLGHTAGQAFPSTWPGHPGPTAQQPQPHQPAPGWNAAPRTSPSLNPSAGTSPMPSPSPSPSRPHSAHHLPPASPAPSTLQQAAPGADSASQEPVSASTVVSALWCFTHLAQAQPRAPASPPTSTPPTSAQQLPPGLRAGMQGQNPRPGPDLLQAGHALMEAAATQLVDRLHSLSAASLASLTWSLAQLLRWQSGEGQGGAGPTTAPAAPAAGGGAAAGPWQPPSSQLAQALLLELQQRVLATQPVVRSGLPPASTAADNCSPLLPGAPWGAASHPGQSSSPPAQLQHGASLEAAAGACPPCFSLPQLALILPSLTSLQAGAQLPDAAWRSLLLHLAAEAGSAPGWATLTSPPHCTSSNSHEPPPFKTPPCHSHSGKAASPTTTPQLLIAVPIPLPPPLWQGLPRTAANISPHPPPSPPPPPPPPPPPLVPPLSTVAPTLLNPMPPAFTPTQATLRMHARILTTVCQLQARTQLLLLTKPLRAQLMALLLRHGSTLAPRTLTALLGGMAAVRLKPPPGIMHQLLGGPPERLQQLAASGQLPRILSSLGHMGFRPSRAWLEAALLALQQQHRVPAGPPPKPGCSGGGQGSGWRPAGWLTPQPPAPGVQGGAAGGAGGPGGEGVGLHPGSQHMGQARAWQLFEAAAGQHFVQGASVVCALAKLQVRPSWWVWGRGLAAPQWNAWQGPAGCAAAGGWLVVNVQSGVWGLFLAYTFKDDTDNITATTTIITTTTITINHNNTTTFVSTATKRCCHTHIHLASNVAHCHYHRNNNDNSHRLNHCSATARHTYTASGAGQQLLPVTLTATLLALSAHCRTWLDHWLSCLMPGLRALARARQLSTVPLTLHALHQLNLRLPPKSRLRMYTVCLRMLPYLPPASCLQLLKAAIEDHQRLLAGQWHMLLLATLRPQRHRRPQPRPLPPSPPPLALGISHPTQLGGSSTPHPALTAKQVVQLLRCLLRLSARWACPVPTWVRLRGLLMQALAITTADLARQASCLECTDPARLSHHFRQQSLSPWWQQHLRREGAPDGVAARRRERGHGGLEEGEGVEEGAQGKLDGSCPWGWGVQAHQPLQPGTEEGPGGGAVDLMPEQQRGQGGRKTPAGHAGLPDIAMGPGMRGYACRLLLRCDARVMKGRMRRAQSNMQVGWLRRGRTVRGAPLRAC